MPIYISKQLPEVITPNHSWPGTSTGAAPTALNANGEQAAPSTAAETRAAAAALPTVRHIQNNVTLLFSPALCTGLVPGKGELYVTDSRLFFYNQSIPACVAIDYPSIGIHAISRGGDTVAGQSAHIYAQLDQATVKADADVPANTQATEPEEGEEDQQEFRLIPDDSAALDAMYQAISSCAALHPDPNGQSDDEEEDAEGGAGWMYSAEDAGDLNELQQAALQHLESVFVGPNPHDPFAGGPATPPVAPAKQADQFADAEEDMQR
ncbi:hypothetical protein HKX48_007710 [Thoreauomyces humboldtii]|nr:hypothetical protein HKX48_007710 [Thoreauomyces humboldtii]